MNLLSLVVSGLFTLLNPNNSGHLEVTAVTNAAWQQKIVFTANQQQAFIWKGSGEGDVVIGQAKLEPNTPYSVEVYFSPDNGESWQKSQTKTTQKDNCVTIGSEDSNDFDYDDAKVIVCKK